MITVGELIACGVAPTQAKAFAGPLGLVMDRFKIVTTPQRAAFIAQCSVESAGFARLEEDLWYSTTARIRAAFARLRPVPEEKLALLVKNPQALANAAYGALNGNRGPASGDGWNFRGSGIMGMTGLLNFQHAAADTGRDYVAHPELVRTNPEDAVMTAGLYWDWNHCNAVIDEGDFDGVSRLINLGNRHSTAVPNGNVQRRIIYARGLQGLAGSTTMVVAP